METIKFNPISAKEFNRMYLDAAKQGKEQFTFQGKAILTSYAKYVCEYLRMQNLLPKK